VGRVQHNSHNEFTLPDGHRYSSLEELVNTAQHLHLTNANDQREKAKPVGSNPFAHIFEQQNG
jgi:hypothetical protein